MAWKDSKCMCSVGLFEKAGSMRKKVTSDCSFMRNSELPSLSRELNSFNMVFTEGVMYKNAALAE